MTRDFFPETPSPRLFRSTRRTLVGFEWKDPFWVAGINQMFRPEGLLVMRAPERSYLTDLRVDGTRVLPLGPVSLPLSTFRLIEELGAASEHGCKARPQYPTCAPGSVVRVHLSDADGNVIRPPELVELALWGTAPVD